MLPIPINTEWGPDNPMPLRTFLDENDISFICTLRAERDDGLMNDLPFHWKCEFHLENRTFVVWFSMGEAHAGTIPEDEDVFRCVAEDTLRGANQTFEDWCAELGYDDDSREAERIFNAIVAKDRDLRHFLGDDLYEFLSESVDL